MCLANFLSIPIPASIHCNSFYSIQFICLSIIFFNSISIILNNFLSIPISIQFNFFELIVFNSAFTCGKCIVCLISPGQFQWSFEAVPSQNSFTQGCRTSLIDFLLTNYPTFLFLVTKHHCLHSNTPNCL